MNAQREYVVYDWYNNVPTSIRGTDYEALRRTADRKNADNTNILLRYTVVQCEQEGR